MCQSNEPCQTDADAVREARACETSEEGIVVGHTNANAAREERTYQISASRTVLGVGLVQANLGSSS